MLLAENLRIYTSATTIPRLEGWDPSHPIFTDSIEKSQGKTATLMIVFPALLLDSGHKNSAKAHQMNLLDLLHPDMLDLSHVSAWKDL